MSENPFSIPEDITDYSHDEAYTRGVDAGIDWERKEIIDLVESAHEALTKAEHELTELGTAFRDYKIVHPEGTEDLHRKLAGQAATLAAIREWRSTTLWAQPNWASLKAILDPPEGTR